MPQPADQSRNRTSRPHHPARMAGVASLSVPLLAEVGVGANWEQAH